LQGRIGHIIKILSHDDQGFCPFMKRMTNGCFAWPSAKEQVAVALTKAELSLLLDGTRQACRSRETGAAADLTVTQLTASSLTYVQT